MTKVLILFYSGKGNTEKMALAVKEGAAKVPDTAVTLMPVKDAMIDDMPEYDAIIIGTPVYFGTMAAPIKDLFDRSGRLQGMLTQKVKKRQSSVKAWGKGWRNWRSLSVRQRSFKLLLNIYWRSRRIWHQAFCMSPISWIIICRNC
jgi:multimeric flavodoxin WrbA